MAYLYHVTFYASLPAIEAEGLRPGKGRGIGGAVYDTHRQGAVFLTEADGVHFWAERAEAWGQSQSDNLYEDELVPVLLRVDEDYFEDFDAECVEDAIGTRDAHADAFKCTTAIDPDDLELWAGADGKGKWVSISDFDEIPFEDAFEVEQDEDTGEDIYWLLDGGGGSILVPPVENRGRRRRARPGRRRGPRRARRKAPTRRTRR